MDRHSIFSGFLELAVLAGAAFYAVFVLISYLTEGSRPRPQVDLRYPARSGQHLAVWLGVKLLALVVQAVALVLAMLSEASAEVGDWFLSNLHHESH
jgi:hypothetical protein